MARLCDTSLIHAREDNSAARSGHAMRRAGFMLLFLHHNLGDRASCGGGAATLILWRLSSRQWANSGMRRVVRTVFGLAPEHARAVSGRLRMGAGLANSFGRHYSQRCASDGDCRLVTVGILFAAAGLLMPRRSGGRGTRTRSDQAATDRLLQRHFVSCGARVAPVVGGSNGGQCKHDQVSKRVHFRV